MFNFLPFKRLKMNFKTFFSISPLIILSFLSFAWAGEKGSKIIIGGFGGGHGGGHGHSQISKF